MFVSTATGEEEPRDDPPLADFERAFGIAVFASWFLALVSSYMDPFSFDSSCELSD